MIIVIIFKIHSALNFVSWNSEYAHINETSVRDFKSRKNKAYYDAILLLKLCNHYFKPVRIVLSKCRSFYDSDTTNNNNNDDNIIILTIITK